MAGFLSAAAPFIMQGIDSLFGRRDRNTADRKAGKVAYAENMQGVLGRVEAAKQAGLHPLSVLGGSFGGSGAPAAVGTDFAGAFESSQNIKAQREATRQFEESLQQRRNEASLRQREADQQEMLNNAQIGRLQKESDWLDEQIRASQEESARRATMSSGAPTPVTKGPNIPDMWVPIRDRHGAVHYVPNPDFFDMELNGALSGGFLLKPEVTGPGAQKNFGPAIQNANTFWRNVQNHGLQEALHRQLQAAKLGLPVNIE